MPHAQSYTQLQTYWVEIQRSSGDSTSHSSHEASKNHGELNEAEEINPELASHEQRLCSKTQRLIDWNVELLEKSVRKIVAQHTAIYGSDADRELSELATKGNPLDEVVEIIELPEFNANVHAQIDEDNVNLPDIAIDELRAFVSGIAAMYNQNAFHSFEHGKKLGRTLK